MPSGPGKRFGALTPGEAARMTGILSASSALFALAAFDQAREGSIVLGVVLLLVAVLGVVGCVMWARSDGERKRKEREASHPRGSRWDP